MVERTLSWLNRFRRLKIRYEHHADIPSRFSCALISLRFLGTHGQWGEWSARAAAHGRAILGT